MRRFACLARALRFECLLAVSIWRSRDCTASKIVLLLGLGYALGPWPLAPDRLPFLGYIDEALVATLALAVARLLIPTNFERRITASYGLSDSEFVGRRLRFARLQAAALAWLLGVMRCARRSGVHLASARRSFALRMRKVRHRPGMAERLFALLGYRAWWRIRSPLAAARCDDPSIVVIGGAPRSGTTLLRSMLGRHPLIASGPETTVFLHRISSPTDLGQRLGWNPAEIEQWQCESNSQTEFIERFRDAVLRQSGKRVWAEKTPHNVFRFGFVRRHFPQAKLIHIVRDGRDVVCSLRRTSFAKLDGVDPGSVAAALRCGVQWRDSVRAGMRFRGDPAYRELHYEDLVRNPGLVLRELLDFLDLPWDDTVLQADATDLHQPDEIAAAGTVFDSSLGRWRQDLSATDRAALRRLIGPLLVQLGYAEDLEWGGAGHERAATPEAQMRSTRP